MEQKIGYKVLKKNRCSAIQYLAREGGRCYPKLKEVKPNKNCGPLCVFTSYKKASKFAYIASTNMLIVKCKYTESFINYIWYDNKFRKHILKLPIGTVLADSVTCLE